MFLNPVQLYISKFSYQRIAYNQALRLRYKSSQYCNARSWLIWQKIYNYMADLYLSIKDLKYWKNPAASPSSLKQTWTLIFWPNYCTGKIEERIHHIHGWGLLDFLQAIENWLNLILSLKNLPQTYLNDLKLHIFTQGYKSNNIITAIKVLNTTWKEINNCIYKWNQKNTCTKEPRNWGK